MEEILGAGSVDTMSETTKNLLEQQDALGQKLETILPLVKQGMGMLDKVGGTEGINKMLETLETNLKHTDQLVRGVVGKPYW